MMDSDLGRTTRASPMFHRRPGVRLNKGTHAPQLVRTITAAASPLSIKLLLQIIVLILFHRIGRVAGRYSGRNPPIRGPTEH